MTTVSFAAVREYLAVLFRRIFYVEVEVKV